MFPIESAPKDDVGILGWFPRSKCYFTMVWDHSGKEWRSFGGEGNFYGESPTGWLPLPRHQKGGE